MKRRKLWLLGAAALAALWIVWPDGDPERPAPWTPESAIPNVARKAQGDVVFWAAVPARIGVFQERSGTARTPNFVVSLALDNNAYRERQIPPGSASWSVDVVDPDGRTVCTASGDSDTPPGAALLPGERWTRPVSLPIPPEATGWVGGEYDVRVAWRLDGEPDVRIEAVMQVER
ncbi:MAG: hypothetical protein HY608_04940 [Planctomycetes bacterium]|nr:hypothetical protein [Planctomycetota bacterium]